MNTIKLNTIGTPKASGGNGGGGGSASSVEYIDVRGVDSTSLLIATQCASSVKWKSGELTTIAPLGLIGPGSEEVEYIAIAIDLSQKVAAPDFGMSELTPLSTLVGSTLASLPRITKEEFYTL